jgi:phosphate transport system substrate-binding protein
VDDGKGGPITPTPETIENGTYKPLSRPVFIYVSKKAAARPEVRKFVEFYLQNADKLVREVNYVSLGAANYSSSLEKFAAGVGK